MIQEISLTHRHSGFAILNLLIVISITTGLTANTPLRAASGEAKIADGEIRLDGRVKTVDEAGHSFVIEVAAFTLPTGKTKIVAPARPKTITLQAQTIFQTKDATAATSADLKSGSVVGVIGHDAGSGQNLPARLVIFEKATETLLSAPSQPAAAPTKKEVAPGQPAALPKAVELVAQVGAKDAAVSVAFSPNGKMLAVGGKDNAIYLWDLKKGVFGQTLKGHTGEAVSLAFSPDGKLLASGGRDNLVIVWDTLTGAAQHKLTGHTAPVQALAFSDDGTQLGSGSLNEVMLWMVDMGMLLFQKPGHIEGLASAALTSDTKKLATGDENGKVQLRDTVSLQVKGTLEGHAAPVARSPFRPTASVSPAAMKRAKSIYGRSKT
jgi:WD40 repeat protein